MSNFIVGAIELVGVLVVSALICWGINKLAVQELRELQKFKEKEGKKDDRS